MVPAFRGQEIILLYCALDSARVLYPADAGIRCSALSRQENAGTAGLFCSGAIRSAAEENAILRLQFLRPGRSSFACRLEKWALNLSKRVTYTRQRELLIQHHTTRCAASTANWYPGSSTSASSASTSPSAGYRRVWCTCGCACITYTGSAPFSRALPPTRTSSIKHEDEEACRAGDADLHREHHPSPATSVDAFSRGG